MMQAPLGSPLRVLVLVAAVLGTLLDQGYGRDGGEFGPQSIAALEAKSAGWLSEAAAAGNPNAEVQLRQIVENRDSTDDAKFLTLWRLYLASRGTLVGQMFLDTIQALKIRDKKGAFRLYEDELKRSDTISASKQSIVRLVGNLYQRASQSGTLSPQDATMNAEILGSLHNAMGRGDTDLARSALLIYTRLDYFPDSVATLARFHESGALSGAAFAREAAFLLGATKASSEQGKVMDALRSLAREGVDVGRPLSFSARLPGYLDAISADQRAALATVIDTSRPRFSGDPSGLSMIETMRLVDWAVAHNEVQGISPASDSAGDFYAAQVLSAKNDPRVALSMLISEVSEPTLNALERQGKLEEVRTQLQNYSSGLQEENYIRALVDEANTKIAQRLSSTPH